MLKTLFSPFGVIERAALLRHCGALYLAQMFWAVLVFVFLYVLTADISAPSKLLIASSYFVFLYLFLCAFSKRLNALSYSRFWLFPIAVIFCSAFFMTANLSIEIVPMKITHFMDKNYPMIIIYTVLSNAVAFLGCYAVSITIAYLPKRNSPPNLGHA